MRLISTDFKSWSSFASRMTLYLVASLALLLPQVAHAWTWETRALMGLQPANPTLLNEGIPNDIQAKLLYTFGADLMFFPPSETLPTLKDWGFGLRFDSISSYMKDARDNPKNSLEVAARLFSLAAQKRWLWNNFFLAGDVSVGVYQPSVVNIQSNGGSWIQYDAKKVRSFSAGLEAGWILDIYVLSAQAGYQYLKLDDLRADDDTHPLTPAGEERVADLSGPYVKVVLGLHF